AEKLGLDKVRILSPKSDTLCKLTTFIPPKDTEKVLLALGEAGAGQIGEYKNCSFQLLGKGHFQPTEAANPHIGQANQLEEVEEHRVEVIFPIHLQGQILSALRQSHPYEEVAYYLHLLQNNNQEIGSGAIGELAEPLSGNAFLAYLKEKMGLKVIRHTAFPENPIQRIAVCGGTGSFLLSAARRQGAEVFVSADFKYHEFFDAEGKILIADIGHYESEIHSNEIFWDLIKDNYPNIPLHISQVVTNPIQYYY
ncbi:MAG: Nif3-like dinuclear metal center hexameric protein, partial [Bacteroidota bacterium]